MVDDIGCRSGLNLVRDSEVTCGSVPQQDVSFAVILVNGINVAGRYIYISLGN